MDTPEALKVVLLGEPGVGKTSIISRYTQGKFDPNYTSSLSAQFITKTILIDKIGRSIKFDIWDTAGQEKYRSLAKIFYKGAKVVIFVYDITSKQSIEGLKEFWVKEAKSDADGDAIFAIVANKSDLYERAEITDDEGKTFAKESGALFQSTSALSDTGIETLFRNIGMKYFNPDFDVENSEKQLKEEYEKRKKEEEEKKKNKGLATKLDPKKSGNKNEGTKSSGGKKCC